jgi:hypothetical protein
VWQPGVTAAWARAHRRIVTRRQLACRALAAVLRRPWLTAALVAMLHHCPSLAAPVTRSLSES